jgi:hypothetical protein
MPHSLNERIAIARRNVVTGRALVNRQLAVIARKRGWGADTSESEDLLALLRQSQTMLEDTLGRLMREKNR